MPTILRTGPYRFFFYATDRDEPLHVHVERDEKLAKVWLDPVRLQSSIGFSPAEIRRIERIIQEHRLQLMEAWHAYFSGCITNPECGEPDRN
ncbi:MAG: DUF4160 domain-containing protein [Deltaproteobacteria bacterium]|nr:DUF4160 domain-containing protein [Deltaproteobacteria bacterium]